MKIKTRRKESIQAPLFSYKHKEQALDLSKKSFTTHLDSGYDVTILRSSLHAECKINQRDATHTIRLSIYLLLLFALFTPPSHANSFQIDNPLDIASCQLCERPVKVLLLDRLSKCPSGRHPMCVYDKNKKACRHFCAKDNRLPAGSYLYFEGNFNSRTCPKDRYQSKPYAATKSSLTLKTNGELAFCPFEKSSCSEEGQVLANTGTALKNSACRCDYRKGYDYVIRPKNICACNPQDEDCTCYLKKCKHYSADSANRGLDINYECPNERTNKLALCQPIDDQISINANQDDEDEIKWADKDDDLDNPDYNKIYQSPLAFLDDINPAHVVTGFFICMVGSATGYAIYLAIAAREEALVEANIGTGNVARELLGVAGQSICPRYTN